MLIAWLGVVKASWEGEASEHLSVKLSFAFSAKPPRPHYIDCDTFPVDPDMPWRAGGESGTAQRARPSNDYQGIGNQNYRQSSGCSSSSSSSSSSAWRQNHWESHPCT